MQFRNAPLVAIVILALITPLVCSSASIASIDDDKLWRESNTVILGTVTSITSEGGGYHYIEVEVEKYLKNPSEAASIVIHYYNRTFIDRYTWEGTTMSGDSEYVEWGFKVGEKVYVFLRRVTPDFYEVLGGFQGKYSIVDGVGVSSIGRVIRIPTPSSQTDMIGVAFGATFGIAVLMTLWIKRDWLSRRIVGLNNG
jgi:hypothetical protein